MVTAVAALVVATLGFLPMATWIPGGHTLAGHRDLVSGWWSGTMVVLGVTAVVLVLTRQSARFPGERLAASLAERFDRAGTAWSLAIALAAALLYLTIARMVFSAKPLLIDEVAQVFQARLFAAGSFWAPAPQYPEFFSTSLLLNLDGRVFSQFPAGAPAMLALGSWLGAEWIVIPLFGAASVLLFASLVRRIEARPGVALGATLLFAFAPFVAFMSGSHMNHVTSLTWLLLGMLGLARVMERASPRFRDGLLLGLGFGVAATIRPSDGLIFALPAGLWLLGRTIRSGGWAVLVASGLGIVLPVSGLLASNAATTGSPFTFGYIALWGAAHDVGFHVSPYGEAHTPARGLELLNLYFVRLQSYLFETPIPSLVPAIGGLALTRRVSAFDRYLLATALLLCLFYFAYWHDGFYIGPRFMIPLSPILAIWTSRGIAALPVRFPHPLVRRGLAVATVISVLIALAISVPIRVRQYSQGMLTMRWDADAAAQRAGVSHALVLVRESWIAQLVARMWAAGVLPNEAEAQYRNSDACAMERVLDRIEAAGLRGPAAVAELKPLRARAAELVRSPLTTDPTNRLLPGSTYTPECIQRLQEDGQGFTLLAPLLLSGLRDDVIYARDLHGRDTLLLALWPDRPVFLLKPPGTQVGASPVFYPVSRDSIWRAARGLAIDRGP